MNGHVLRKYRRKQAAGMTIRLRRLGHDVGPVGVRWMDEDPTANGDPDWTGPGYYYRDEVDGVALLGVDIGQATNHVTRICSEYRKQRARIHRAQMGPRRAARAEDAKNFGRKLLTSVVHSVVTSVVSNPVGAVKAGVEIAGIVRDAVKD